MKRINGIFKSNIRFRKWTRKSWAVFHSIGREITIGRLILHACDQALRKNNILTVSTNNNLLRYKDENESIPLLKSSEKLLLNLFLLLSLLIMISVENTPISQGYIINYHTKNKQSCSEENHFVCSGFFIERI